MKLKILQEIICIFTDDGQINVRGFPERNERDSHIYCSISDWLLLRILFGYGKLSECITH